MVELARGRVTDRPWGRTLAALGLRAITGQLTLRADGKHFLIAFEHGAVVAAASPLASDAAVRVALTSHLVSSSQVPEISRQQAASPGRDEIDVIAELARLGPDQALRLRRRVIAQRAARTFSIDHGEFLVTDDTELEVLPGCELDVRAIIYMGAHANLSELRLASELAQLGGWFRLKPAVDEDLPQFGFTDVEQPVVARLRDGGTLAELEDFATHFVGPRTVRAVVYALAAYNACEVGPAPAGALHRRAEASSPGLAATHDASVAAALQTPPYRDPPTLGHPAETSDGDAAAHLADDTHARGGTSAGSPEAAAAAIAGRVIRRVPSSRPPVARQVARTDSPHAHNVKALIAQRLKQLDQGADHFQLIGVPPDASLEALRKAYFALARKLHPDRLAALGISDDGKHAQRLFAQINAGFAILSDPARRDHYVNVLRRGGAAAIQAEQAKAEELARRILDAEEAFRRGELALRRDQPQAAIAELERAIQLNPDEADYHALLAWSQFCAAPDKRAVASATRTALDKAVQRSPRSVTARFYLGRVERMLGRDQDALRHFRDVLLAAPGHTEAAAELRVIEARQAGGDKPAGGGIFGRSKR